ncbi:MAG: MBL fold metallo-hydrolase [Hyphomicrobiaceae bacterium]|nr:MBL fold metallo-hydrolase [Hyphomicrobiaceae bacterium]
MTGLLEADSVEILILVDNVTDNLSSTPRFVETELSRLARRGVGLVAGDCLCCAAHGLSCLVTVRRGGEERTLLFDTGPEADVFARNAQRLGADLGKVGAIVLSHGHWDHGGGLLRALDLVRGAGGPREVPFYAHPGMFRQRASKTPDGSFRLMEDVPQPRQLTLHGAKVIQTTEPQHPLDGFVWVSGEIPRVTPYEKGLPGQHRRTDDGMGWEPDELLMDERCVAVNVKGKGLVVLSACSHAGIVNVLTHVRASFPGVPLHAAMGGLHLSGTNERIIPETVRDLGAFRLTTIAAGHCTGWRAMAALMNAYGDERLVPLAVGKRFSF